MFSGRRSARSGPGVLGAMPASGATGDGLIESAMGKTRSSISGNIPVLPEQIPVAAVRSRNFSESQPPLLLRLCRFSGRLGIIRCKLPFQSAPFQQRLDVRIAPDKILKQTQRVSRTTATEQRLSEAFAILALQPSMFFNPFHAIGIEHFAPDVRVISRGISSGKRVR